MNINSIDKYKIKNYLNLDLELHSKKAMGEIRVSAHNLEIERVEKNTKWKWKKVHTICKAACDSRIFNRSIENIKLGRSTRFGRHGSGSLFTPQDMVTTLGRDLRSWLVGSRGARMLGTSGSERGRG